MNTEFESYAGGGRVDLSVQACEGGSASLVASDDENGGQTLSEVGYSLGYCNDTSIRAAFDGVWLELSTAPVVGEDERRYQATIEARLSWEQASVLHDYLGMLLRLPESQTRGPGVR